MNDDIDTTAVGVCPPQQHHVHLTLMYYSSRIACQMICLKTIIMPIIRQHRRKSGYTWEKEKL